MASAADKPRKRSSWIASLRPSTPKDSPTSPRIEVSQLSRIVDVNEDTSYRGNASTSTSATTSATSSTFALPSPQSTSGAELIDLGVSPTCKRRRRLSANLLTSPFKGSRSTRDLDDEAAQLVRNALERTSSAPSQSSVGTKSPDPSRSSGSFGRLALSSVMGGLSALSLSRTSTNNSTGSNTEEPRGRSITKTLSMQRSTSAATPDRNADSSRSRSRARSQSPFFRRLRQREISPTPEPLPLAPADLETADTSTSNVLPRTAYNDEDSGDETVGGAETETDDESSSDDEFFDTVTERNTETNALIAPTEGDSACLEECDLDADPDPTGEGVNVVVPPEPYFPSTLNTSSSSLRGKKNPRRRKSTKHEPLQLRTSRLAFARDRCTITITQGDPESKLDGRKQRKYVVASDLSDESRYAVEWGIGTVLRDGDEMMIVTIMENESRVDPPIVSAADRSAKLRSQQERQGLAYILVRQATSLLQRTRLNVTIVCQAWHAKNARHILLDIVDYYEPTMLIVGSRGLGQLKGILLGSTSHYLIQKCSVPVMVARRRLRRPPRHSAHLAKHRAHIPLAKAGIDRVAPKVDRDVKVMREEIKREEEEEEARHQLRDMEQRVVADVGGVGALEEDIDPEEGEDDPDEDVPPGVKVAG